MIDTHIVAWLNLAARWTHVIAGIAWIGTSFYFNWLDSRLEKPERAEQGIGGELWAVHSGGFYKVQKFQVAPDRLPKTLHWFKWEAYLTWITGAALLVLIYYLGADAYLLGASAFPVSVGGAISLSVAVLVGGWVVYDFLCRSPLARNQLVLGSLLFVLAVAVAFGLATVFSSRAAFIHVGAMLGTIMAANVFFVIIPSQKELVAATSEGRARDPTLGERAKQRSIHNNYMTLPLLFIMVSGHYPFTYGHQYHWLILAGLAVIGAGVRHYFNLRNRGQQSVWILPTAAVGIVALAFVTRPAQPGGASSGEDAEVPFPIVQSIVQQRCTTCHSANPTHAAYPQPPLGVVMDTPEQIRSLADRIQAVAVSTTTMPLANLTRMTDEERALLGKWIQSGADIN